jgi:hypothetical protein
MGHWYAWSRGCPPFYNRISACVGQLETRAQGESEEGLVRGNGGEVVTVKLADRRDGD